MKLRRFTPTRWKALAWFRDHEADQNSVMGRPVPGRRLVNMMIEDGQVERVYGYVLAHPVLVLTEKGQAILRSKHKKFSERTRARLLAKRLQRNKRRERTDASRPETAEPNTSARLPR